MCPWELKVEIRWTLPSPFLCFHFHSLFYFFIAQQDALRKGNLLLFGPTIIIKLLVLLATMLIPITAILRRLGNICSLPFIYIYMKPYFIMAL